MLVSTGKRAGPSHRQREVPCQDAYHVQSSPDGARWAAAVGDGLGSRRLSHEGSEVATRAAAQSLAGARTLGAPAVHRAFRAARKAVQARAKELGVKADDLATTLQIAAIGQGRIVAGAVGDGAILYATDGPRILLAPEDQEYANQVAPLTSPDWQDHLRVATAEAATHLFLFTDGLTRLLLTRQDRMWSPYQPFFDAFLPKLRNGADPQLVARFLDNDSVDGAWDDDKCLVVIGDA